MLYTPTKYDPHFNFNDYYSNSERDYPNAFNGILIYEPTPGEEFFSFGGRSVVFDTVWHGMVAYDIPWNPWNSFGLLSFITFSTD